MDVEGNMKKASKFSPQLFPAADASVLQASLTGSL
jgi:hypothetical protein